MERIKPFSKDDLYKRSGWFSKDCESLIAKLAVLGLAIVDQNEVEQLNQDLVKLEDDGK